MNRPKTMTPAAALVRLEELCARSEQCTYEIQTKLNNWGIQPEMAKKIIARLRAHKFLDDSRYALAFARDKVVYNRWGILKVKQGLHLKRIDNDLIDEAIASIDSEEYRESLIEVIRAKGNALKPPFDFAKKQKILRHAASRGFEPSLIIDIIKHPELWE